jgi:transcriptional regulator with GAF, ATPase, and Fis domain
VEDSFLANNKVSAIKTRGLWKSLDDTEREIVLYLVNTIEPVLIDTLCTLSEAPIVKVLNVMEHLRKRNIVYETRQHGKGIYFLNCAELSNYVKSNLSAEKSEKPFRRVIDFYKTTLADETKRTIILAKLYWQLGDRNEGIGYIKSAADILHFSGQHDKAVVYYDFLLKTIAQNSITSVNVDSFLDATLGKLSITKHLMPIHEQVSLLDTAQKVAKRYAKWDAMANIRLALGQALKAAGQYNKASRCFNDFWKFAEKIGDAKMLKIAALSMSDFLFWKGRVADAIRRYEEVIGDREEFSDNEATLKAIAAVGWCYVINGRVSRGLGMIEAVRAKAESLRLKNAMIYADLMSALSYIDMRKISEAESYLNKIFTYSNEILGHYVLWAANGMMAYIYFTKQEYQKSYECQRSAVEHSRILGWMHHRGPYNFEYIAGLEEKGLFHEEMNYDSEIKRILSWDDIYMKGVALRYRALRNLEKQNTTSKVLLDLRNSEKYLKKAGAEIELARTRVVLGQIYLQSGELKSAQSYLEKAWSLFSKVNKDLFPKDLLIYMPQDQKIEVIIDSIINISETIGIIKDRSTFLERVLNVAMDFAMAMRGAFFVVDSQGELTIFASRNLDAQLIKLEQFKLIEEVVFSVARDGEEFIMPSISEKDKEFVKLLMKTGISSCICMPSKLGETIHGYLYLDNRLGGISFTENQLPYMRLLCNQIAVGLSNINIYEEMRTLKERFEEEAFFYKREMGIATPLETIVGSSQEMKIVIGQIQQVAHTDSSVLISGETGVGKELVAKAIHNLSNRKNGSFIPVNLAALPQELVASELFGHEKGAFTGAMEKAKGRFELANAGTIFLDEVGDLPPAVQVKLLRVLQEGVFERLGSSKPIRSSFRVIAATNKDLSVEVEKGNFRQDLYYRLNVFPIHVPPLRERKDDIPLLAQHFINKFSKKMGKAIRRIPADSVKTLMDYRWPGNVRELSHFIERAVILFDGNRITFPDLCQTSGPDLHSESLGSESLDDIERHHIEKVLNSTYWKISGPRGAASILGLKRTTLLARMKKLGISKPSERDLTRRKLSSQ